MTPEQRQQKMMQAVGGILEKSTALPGVLFLNLQKRVDAEHIAATAKSIANSTRFKHTTEARNGDGREEILKALARTKDVAIVIALVDEPDQPSLLMAQDQGWAQVNVAALAADKPAMEKLQERLTKQLWRATGLVFGAGYSQQFPTSVMQPVRNLAALDAIVGKTYATDTVQSILKSAGQVGVASYHRFTYKQACEQGWAPAPTNQWQQAIWDAAKAAKQ